MPPRRNQWVVTDADTQEKVRRAVKLGLTAYTLEWDGHVQAMTGRREFWSGTGQLSLRAPTVRLARSHITYQGHVVHYPW